VQLEGARPLARSDVGMGKVRLGGELLVQGLAALAPQVGLGGRHGGGLSVGGDDEDRRVLDLCHPIHLNRLMSSAYHAAIEPTSRVERKLAPEDSDNPFGPIQFLPVQIDTDATFSVTARQRRVMRPGRPQCQIPLAILDLS